MADLIYRLISAKFGNIAINKHHSREGGKLPVCAGMMTEMLHCVQHDKGGQHDKHEAIADVQPLALYFN